MNPDEESNYLIAMNHHLGNGYTKTQMDSGHQVYINTSYHGSFTVFLYEWLIDNLVDFDLFILGFLALSALFHFVELLMFYKIGSMLLNQKYALIGLLLFAVFPPVIFYVGPLFLYEPIVTCFILCGVGILIGSYKTTRLKYHFVLLLLVMSLVSIMLRGHALPIWFLIFLVYLLSSESRYRIRAAVLFVSFVICAYLVHIPVMNKNYTMFGHRIISTQTGFALFEGANPKARGSWDGTGGAIKSELAGYDTQALDEFEQSEIFRHKALDWVFGHPLQYGLLLLRKLGIYFLPQNYEVLPYSGIYNPLNVIVYIGFLLFTISLMRKKMSCIDVLLYAPIVGSVLLTLVFFVGYRWRYYAEPFMIILALRWLTGFRQRE